MNLDRVIALRNDRTVYRDGDRCIKTFCDGYSKAEVLGEALNQTRAQELGLLAPTVFAIEMIDGKWAIVSEYVKGRTLAQLLQQTPEKQTEYISSLVKLQLQMHKKTASGFVNLRDKLRGKIAAASLDSATCAALQGTLASMPVGTNLCHGDLQPSNVIVAEDGSLYILDWAQAAQGNALADAAKTYLLFVLAGDECGGTRYLDIFSSMGKVDKQDVVRWIPLVAAAQLPMANERERALLLRYIPTAENG